MSSNCCGTLGKVAMFLVMIGAINWGLVGALEFDLVQWLFVDTLAVPVAAQVVYILVGVSGLYTLVKTFSCKSCEK